MDIQRIIGFIMTRVHVGGRKWAERMEKETPVPLLYNSRYNIYD